MDDTNVFFADLAMKLIKNTSIEKNIIKLIEGKQPLYGPIYSLGQVELETLKAYIKTHLKIRFIQLSKFFAGAFILFDKKPNGSFYLCVNYQSLNNLRIKNCYLLPLIGKSLDRLRRTKQFIQLDLTSAYHQMKI